MENKNKFMARGMSAVAAVGVTALGLVFPQAADAAVQTPRPAGFVNAGEVVKIHAGLPNTTVLGNLTVTQPKTGGHTTAYPCDKERPKTSVNNFVAGQTVPNFTAVLTDGHGDFCVYTSATAHLIWDQNAESDTFGAHAPVRKADTRVTKNRLRAGDVLRIVAYDTSAQAAGAPKVSVYGNLTVVNPSGSGYTTLYDCDKPRPTASVNNFVAGQTVPNFAATNVSDNGQICIYASADTDLLWDQVAENTAPLYPTASRMMDTRKANQRVKAGGVLEIAVADNVWSTGPVADGSSTAGGVSAATVAGNLTVVNPFGAGHTTAYPCDQPRPNASVNNFVAGKTTPNFALVKTSASGKICVYSTADADILWDQVLYDNGTSWVNSHPAARLMDTRYTEPVFPTVQNLNVNLSLDVPPSAPDAQTAETPVMWRANVDWTLPAGVTVSKVYWTKTDWVSAGMDKEFATNPVEVVDPVDSTHAVVHGLTGDAYYRVGVVPVSADGRVMPLVYITFTVPSGIGP